MDEMKREIEAAKDVSLPEEWLIIIIVVGVSQITSKWSSAAIMLKRST